MRHDKGKISVLYVQKSSTAYELAFKGFLFERAGCFCGWQRQSARGAIVLPNDAMYGFWSCCFGILVVV